MEWVLVLGEERVSLHMLPLFKHVNLRVYIFTTIIIKTNKGVMTFLSSGYTTFFFFPKSNFVKLVGLYYISNQFKLYTLSSGIYLSSQHARGCTACTMLATSANVCVETSSASKWLRLSSL